MIRSIVIICIMCATGILHAQPHALSDTLIAINVSALNSNEDESFPFLEYYTNNIYFSRNDVVNRKIRIWGAARTSDSTWSDPQQVLAPNRIGPVMETLISDSSGEVFFSSMYETSGPQDVDIFALENGQAINLGPPVNTTLRESEPSITPDGQDLYFVSSRGLISPKVNIFVSHRTGARTWSEPVRVGSKINSMNVNSSPFIVNDGKTLLFSSGGKHGDYGPLKLYISVKTGANDTDWSDPILLPYPINDYYNSISPCLSHDNSELYFASDRPGGKGKMDIYMVRLPHGLASLYPQAAK